MVVAMGDELGAVRMQQALQRRRILEPARRPGLAWQRRMMNEQQPKEPGATRAVEHVRKLSQLGLPSWPDAINGGVGTAELRPIRATSCNRRTNGNAAAGPPCVVLRCSLPRALEAI